MQVNLGVIHEFITGLVPDREAVVSGDRVVTYGELAARTRRLANALGALGLGCHTERAALQPWESGHDHVALYMHNGLPWIECMFGVLKARAAYVNVNYRYKASELVYLLANAGARAIIYHGSFAPVVAAVRRELPDLKHFIQVDDGSGEPLLPGAVDYEQFVDAASDAMPALPYSPDDLYVLFTGGTTGMPKGVLWRQEDVFYNGLGGHIPGFPRLETWDQLRDHVGMNIGGRALVCLPFMHGAGQWQVFNTFHRAGTVVLPTETRRLDAHGVWQAIERHQADTLMITGDAFARPLLAALEERRYDLTSLRVVASTAAVLSRSVREEIRSAVPEGVMMLESIGGSDFGVQGLSSDTDSGQPGLPAYPLREHTVLLREDLSGILPSGTTGEIGWIASSRDLPLGYLGDSEKTRQVYRTIGGVRYAVGGDRGRWLDDGRVLFLGRESSCINTGGEKVFVEEVERVVKSHPAVYDALVVGLPNARWGQQVTAVVSVKPGSTGPSLEALRAHCAPHLADYKVPKELVTAPEIVRSPSGKPDYAWAKQFALQATTR